MRIKLLTNLGTRDSEALGLSAPPKIGEEHDVSDSVGKQLLTRGWCELIETPAPPVEKPAEKPAKIQTVAPKATIVEKPAVATDKPKAKSQTKKKED